MDNRLVPAFHFCGFGRDDDIQLELMCTGIFCYLIGRHNKKCWTHYTFRQKDHMSRYEIWFHFYRAIPTQRYIGDLYSCFQLHLSLFELLHAKCVFYGYYYMSPLLVACLDRTVSGCRSNCLSTE
jgi:hypothetical protein